jgi:hypothetical protein
MYPTKQLRRRYLLLARALLGISTLLAHAGIEEVADDCDAAGFHLLVLAGRADL